MKFLLSITTVFPRTGARVWYDDQREVHRQIFGGEESVNYAFMGDNADAAENRWLREASQHRVPIIYFLGIAPRGYQALVPAFAAHRNRRRLMAGIRLWRNGSVRSYCQIWCTEGWSCGGPAVLYDLDAVRELDPLDHFAELPEAA